MGDEGRLYLAPELVPAYKNNIMNLASILTPNQYEAELLTDVQIDSKQNALQACQVLHDQGIHTVVSACLCRQPGLMQDDNGIIPFQP